MIIYPGNNKLAVLPTYSRMCRFSILVRLFTLFAIHTYYFCTYSVLMELQKSECLALKTYMHNYSRRLTFLGKSYIANSRFVSLIVTCLYAIEFALWLNILLFCFGDVHPNPGALSTSSSDNSISSATIFSSPNTSHNLSFVHDNVQSIPPKLEILHAELFKFDILAFTETWFSQTDNSYDLLLQSYNRPERKNRVGDSHGGVILYIKEGIHYYRRKDREIRGIESIWVELANKHNCILFGLFYRPHGSSINYYSDIENSLNLAVDTDISSIIVTGDFNLNVLNQTTLRKIEHFCTQFSLHQSVNQPTHFTEHSSSLIDILLVSNKDNLILSGVGDPYLNQVIRYHCPIYVNFRSQMLTPLCVIFGVLSKVTTTYCVGKLLLLSGPRYKVMT